MSTQASSKLLRFQDKSDIEEYKNSRPKKLIQDVSTRWWSTYAAIERALFLKKAIKGLLATKEVDCEELKDDEWDMLEQIIVVLEPFAFFQRVLEGESYVTGSMVPCAAFNIRRTLNDIIENPETNSGVSKLSKVLLDDLDTRFKPNTDDPSKLSFSWGACIGFRKRYTTVHHYFFVAAFLDPRVKSDLSIFMTNDDYKALQGHVLRLMVEEAQRQKIAIAATAATAIVTQSTTNSSPPSARKNSSSPKVSTVSRMFNRKPEDKTSCNTTNKENANPLSIENTCENELKAFMSDSVAIPLTVDDDDSVYTNPLEWWKMNEKTYPHIACLARSYLAIPATSAPSERIFSRAGRLLTVKRASMSSDIAQRMMIISENASVLQKHYDAIVRPEKKNDELHLIKKEKMMLPCYSRMEDQDRDEDEERKGPIVCVEISD